MIGSTRPKSLNEVKKFLSLYATRRPGCDAAGVLAGFRHPAWPGLSSVQGAEEAGRNRETSCTRPAEARIETKGPFIRAVDMAVQRGVCKAKKRNAVAEGIDNLKPMRECPKKAANSGNFDVVYPCVQGS